MPRPVWDTVNLSHPAWLIETKTSILWTTRICYTEPMMLPGSVPWPRELAERYRRQGYWRGEVLGDLLRHWAQVEPGRIALVYRDRRFGYGELDAGADRLAA